MISALEEDYRAFETAITADYDAQSTVEAASPCDDDRDRLFEIQGEHLQEYPQTQRPLPNSYDGTRSEFRPHPSGENPFPDYRNALNKIHMVASSGIQSGDPALALAQSFLRLANLPNFALDRLSRYEAALWRQVAKKPFALDALDRRKPTVQSVQDNSWPARLSKSKFATIRRLK